jgi:hypothetical protein
VVPIADNSAQTGADTIATDDVTTLNGGASSGVKVQRVKVGYGDDASYRDASSAFPLPVNLAASAAGAAQTSQALTASAAATLAGAASTSGSWVLDAGPAGNASFELVATAFVGTVVFEQSYDAAGANGRWAAVPVMPEDGSAPISSLAINTAVAYVRQFSVGMLGPKLFRVRCSAFTSGTLTVTGSGGPGWYEGQPSLAAGSNNIGTVAIAIGSTGTVTTVNTNGTANTNSVSLAADPNRDGLLILNRGTAPVNIGFGTTVTSTVYSLTLAAGQLYEVPQALVGLAVNTMSAVASVPLNFTAVT